MKQLKARIVQMEEIAKRTFKMDIRLPFEQLQKIKPGQFVHVRVSSGVEHMLRRPISIADVDYEQQKLTVIFKVFGEGTKMLSELQHGQQLDLIVPCGHGYPIEKLKIKQALLVGGGVGVPPLYLLAKKLVDKGVEVTTVIGFQTKDDVFYEDAFQKLGTCFVATNDGSYGTKGFVTDIIQREQIDFEYYFSCGPTAMLKAVQAQLSHVSGYISLEERMGCGVGACYACVVPSADGMEYKKICADGPVFAASEVMI